MGVDASEMFGGKGSAHRLEKSKKCRRCRKETVVYTGSSVLHGNPFCGTADTEVDHYYRCAREECEHEWTEYA
jgi:hypothetical protein